jgi:ABC-type transport system substrate-binding protein
MRSIRRTTELFALAAALSTSLSCKSEVKDPIGVRREVPPQRGGTLRGASFVNVRSLDPAVAFDAASNMINRLIYDTLMSYDEGGKLVPELAESVEVSSDGKRYAFTLRPRVQLHDGRELTAADVKRSLERALHPQTPCPVGSYYERIAGYRAYHDGKANELAGVEVAGERTLVISLSEPDATFLHVMALSTAAPVCNVAGRAYDRNFSRAPCGSGPFVAVEYEPNQRIRLKRHEGYWRKGQPYLDAIDWQLSVQQFAQRFKFERGELDYMRDFSEADSSLFRQSPAWRGLGEWEKPLITSGVFMNTEIAPFDNRHVRRAVSFAIDRKAIASVYPGHIMPKTRVVPDALLDPGPPSRGQRYDLGRALEEMRLAGYAYDPATGSGGYPHEIRYLAIGDSFSQGSAELYQQQLAKIGIRTRLELVSFPTYLARASRRRTTAMAWVAWSADYADPSTFLEPNFSSAAIQEEESMNMAFFSNSRVDALLVQARRSTDAARRSSIYREAEDIVLAEAPWAVSYAFRFFELWQPYFHGYRPHPIVTQNLRGAYFDLEQRRALAAGGLACRGPFAALDRRCRSAKRGGRSALALGYWGAR